MANVAKILVLAFTLFIVISPVNIASSYAQQNATSATAELALWNQIKDSGDVSQIKTYLNTFPNGMFYDVAIAKYKNLGGNPAELIVAKASAPVKQIAKATVKKQVNKTVLMRVHRPTRARVHRTKFKVIHVAYHKAHVVTHKLKRHLIIKKVKFTPTDPQSRGGSGSGSGGGGGGGGGNGGGGSHSWGG